MFLVGMVLLWCFFDIVYYGVSFNNVIILDVIGYLINNVKNIYEIFYNIVIGNMIIVFVGVVLGYWVIVFIVDIIGCKFI